MALSQSLSEVCTYVFNKLDASANKIAIGYLAVFYGDQDKLPTTPMICIEPDRKVRTLNGVPRRTLVEFRVHVILYHSGVTSPQTNRRDADEMAEEIEALLHADPRLGASAGTQLAVNSLVTSIESGYVTKAGSLVRASRLTFDVTSQAQLPQ